LERVIACYSDYPRNQRTPNEEIAKFVERVVSARRSIEESYGFCRFAADTECIMVPISALDKLCCTRKRVSFIQPIPWGGAKRVWYQCRCDSCLVMPT
jgi:hypothetical protein